MKRPIMEEKITKEQAIDRKKVLRFASDNIVTLIFVVFTLTGFVVSSGVGLEYFLNELNERVFRNLFLVLSLIIPVIAGLGLNFGIVVGAMAGQIAIAIVRYFGLGGSTGTILCFLITLPVAMLFGYLTGLLYNKTKGQEMIAGLIVGFFANGIYQFLFLFVVGVIIPVPANHPMIKPDGYGIRSTVDLGATGSQGLKYAIDAAFRIPLIWAVLLLAVGMLAMLIYKKLRNTLSEQKKTSNLIFYVNAGLCVLAILFSIICIATDSPLMYVRQVPALTLVLIIALCIFTELIMKTKLGQDFRSVGQDQHISEISGINVDKRRIQATVISTVFAGWGQIIYLQNMGTLNTYNAHSQIGMFSVAALLVGGASTSRANIKHAIIGTILFNAMFIMSPEIGLVVFGQALLGEYFRTFMVYGVIGLALSLYVWKTIRKPKVKE